METVTGIITETIYTVFVDYDDEDASKSDEWIRAHAIGAIRKMKPEVENWTITSVQILPPPAIRVVKIVFRYNSTVL